MLMMMLLLFINVQTITGKYFKLRHFNKQLHIRKDNDKYNTYCNDINGG